MASEKPQRPRRILFLTNSDRGEVNVCLATSHALIHADPDVEIHFATFGGMEASVASIWQNARLSVPQAKPIVFHKIGGLTMAEGISDCLARKQFGHLPESFLESPSIANTTRAIQDTITIFVPYSGPQLVEVLTSIVGIIKRVDADLVVVNSLMTAGLTVCYHMGVRFTCLSPNSIKEFAGNGQPMAACLWKFPALFSGFSYPVPWHLIPLNVYFMLYMAVKYRNDSHLKQVKEYVESHTGVTLRTPIDLLRDRPANLKILVSSLPELDFPLLLPPHVLPCGPIINHAPPISESDPELGKWLARGPTVYVNLGSLVRVAEDQASELARALKIVLGAFQSHLGVVELQVLWKLKKEGHYQANEPGSRVYEVLKEEIEHDRVRIVDWIQTEPIAILRTGHIVCSVHHGGANSYNENVLAGVPHVVLPQWTDCYDYAQRVEMLGIGRWGSRTTKPQWSAEELSRELLEVLMGEKSDAMKQKAEELAYICQKHGNGAGNAARILLGECS